jgi:hypothetical protein
MISRIWNAMLAAAPLSQWIKFGGAVITTTCFIGMVFIVWLGGWPWYLASARLNFLGIGMLVCCVLMGLYTVNATGTSIRGRFGNNEIDLRSAAEQAGREAARDEVAKAVEATPKKD